MSQITIHIDGRAYRLACEEGQEAHLEDLATQLDSQVEFLKQNFGDIGDLRIMVMASIMILDELSQTKIQNQDLANQIQKLQTSYEEKQLQNTANEKEILNIIAQLNHRVEKLTQQLEDSQ